MRYREIGQVHMDFHRTTNGTIRYLRETYGVAFLDEIFRRTAHDVYKSIHEDLKAGDPQQLIEHWTYYMDREGGEYSIERNEDTITMTVTKCPADAYLKDKGVEIDEAFRQQTSVLNAALSEGTPFEITTDDQGGGRYTQTIRRVRS